MFVTIRPMPRLFFASIMPDPRSGPRPRLLAVATSAGGPPALQILLSGLVGFPAPIVIVQHIAAGFVQGLATWLTTVSGVSVRVATAGEHLLDGTAYLAPDGAHLLVTGAGRAALDPSMKSGRFKPSADALFTSVAQAYRAEALGVILTGMGRDGVEGAGRLRAAGSRVLVQEPSTAAVTGMPEAAIEADVAVATMPVEAMPDYIRAAFKG